MTTPEDQRDRELAALMEEIAAERPEPDPEWAAKLDASVRDGFGRRGSSVGSRLRAAGTGLREHFGARLTALAFGGVAASMLVAVVVAVIVIQVDGGSDEPAGGDAASQSQAQSTAESSAGGSRDALEAPSAASEAGGETSYFNDSAGDRALKEPAGPNANTRKQDRDARLELRTRPAEVRSVSDQAISIIESVGGIVLNSNLREQGERSQAQLRLRVPAGELDPVLDRLTDLATVASLNESVTDITSPFASAKDRLTDARAERRKLLDALGSAGDGEEAATLRKQLAKTRKRIARSESAFQRLVQRSRNSEIDLQIKGRTPEGSTAAGADPGDGSWTVAEVLGDAADVLKATLGGLLVGAAALLPLALLALLARLIHGRYRQRQREQALASS